MTAHKAREIVTWAKARGIFEKAMPETQFDKTMEEVDELWDGIQSGDIAEIKDAIGDIYVTLVIQANMHGLTMTECIDAAWEEIKDRKGRMVDGKFVKEAE